MLKVTDEETVIDGPFLKTALQVLSEEKLENLEEFKVEPLEKIENLDFELIEIKETEPEEKASDKLYTPARKYLYKADLDDGDPKYDNKKNDTIKVVTEAEANLISSECFNGNHAPVIDIDIPIEVYPSSQLGHYHLYINKEMSWDQYVELLKVLAKCGIVEEGYVNASIAQGHSSLRPVGDQKQTAPRGSHVLKQNAEFRKLIYELRQMLLYTTAKVDEKVDWELVKERDQLAEKANEHYKQSQELQNEVNQLREELNRTRLQQVNVANISWT